ncbi:MAG: RagB/SusD family nutrient uptake outer membrane protein [Bacteroidaceae bacterium]|nr:RagB/SusD family nutrient uptake outer membrane protein [Bacteroidaceae bacterium]
MNKKIFKRIFVMATAALLVTSCIEETFPESSSATADQVGASASALEASLNGIPTQMSQWYYVYGEQEHETDMAYLMFPIADTELLGDMYPEGSNSGYDWFRSYNICTRFGESEYIPYLSWFSLYKLIKAANDVISAAGENPEGDALRTYLAEALTCRALYYYQLMVHWEPVENKYTDCSEVLGLTVPIVTEKTTGEDSKHNPRVSHDEMMAFIIGDLDKAEELMVNEPKSKALPSLACVYGVKARAYMWDKDFANAAKYARLAITTHGGTPVTEAQWLDLNTGFNTENQAWMWKCTYSAENMANLCNWTGWMSAEADWGYSSLTCPAIDRSLYDKIAYTDFRKYTFLDPDRSVYNYQTCRGQEWLDDQPDYLALKFRCKGGDFETYTIGGLVDVPIMRVEEFYLIEAEAVAASQNVPAGIALLNSFMQTYRQPDYNYQSQSNSLEAFQKEVNTQMRIEFWGEGEGFAGAKRLKVGVMQNYAGTNAPADNFKINCEGIKPNWNFVIPQFEIDSNPDLGKQNNPDPSSVVVGPSPEGQYAE